MEVVDIAVYPSITGKFYDTTTSLFMHLGGKKKLGTVKWLWMYHHFGRLVFFIFVLLTVPGQLDQKSVVILRLLQD